jgi:hypothetical protein
MDPGDAGRRGDDERSRYHRPAERHTCAVERDAAASACRSRPAAWSQGKSQVITIAD